MGSPITPITTRDPKRTIVSWKENSKTMLIPVSPIEILSSNLGICLDHYYNNGKTTITTTTMMYVFFDYYLVLDVLQDQIKSRGLDWIVSTDHS